MRMRHLERVGVDLQLVDSDDVDVYRTVTVGAVGVAVWPWVETTLNLLKDAVHLLRSLVGDEHQAYVAENISGIETPWFRFHFMGNLEISESFLHGAGSLADVQHPRSDVGADVNEVVHVRYL